MKIVGAYHSLESMNVQKDFCPFYRRATGHVPSCVGCPTLRYGSIGTLNSQPINKYWCGAGGKPDFMEVS